MSDSMSRRQWLTAASTFAGAAAFTGPLTQKAAAGQFTGKIRKGVKYHMIDEPKMSVQDKFAMLRQVGIEGVEFKTDEQVSPDEVLAARDATGLVVHGVVNSSSPDIRRAIELSRRFGGTSVLVTVPNDAKKNYMTNYRERQQIIRRAVPDAEKHQISILIENVWASFLIEPLTMARFIDEIGSPWVGCYFDIGNNIRWGHAHHWIQVLGKRIGKLDVKEYNLTVAMNEGMRKGFDFPLGEGGVDWKAVRDELAKLDFRGWATAEVSGGGRERMADISRQMDRVLDL